MNKRRMLLLASVILMSVAASGCGYNTLQTKQQNVKASWSNIESQLQRRSDLIPNLFEAAKAAGYQEQQVFGDIANARAGLSYALPFSAGVTLYVAASDLIPEVNHKEEKNPMVSIVVFVGVALFYLLHRLIEG